MKITFVNGTRAGLHTEADVQEGDTLHMPLVPDLTYAPSIKGLAFEEYSVRQTATGWEAVTV